MAISRTLEFLPDFLKTTANKKFLSATLDQLISEPRVKKFNGYIGRQFVSGYQSDDRYIIEPTNQRQNYQLEPSVVSLNANKKVESYSGYNDLLQQINFYGGITTDHSRLFANQSYTYDPHVNFDKISNFGNYYWLPDGPQNVDVGIKTVSANKDFELTANPNRKVYTVKFQNGYNPELVLRRGGTYRFIVNQPGQKFYIQSEPGANGRSATNSRISTRSVLGVTNNGDDVGTITFIVPSKSAQDSFRTMTVSYEPDFATTLRFNQIDNKLLSDVKTIDGFQGDIQNKYIVFVNQSTSPLHWTSSQAVDGNGTPVAGYPARTILSVNRANVFQIKLIPVPNGTLVTLNSVFNTPANSRVFIKYGETQAGLEYYRPTGQNYLQSYPSITADLDTLYYQNESDATLYGKLKIVDENSKIDIEEEILGKTEYISPNNVVFTNGLKITFDNQVTPEKYQNKTYIVEGVGQSIKLIDFNPTTQSNIDYITISRSAIDRNDWAYTNRWTHDSVIKQAAEYNKTAPIYNQNYRARRPIIEFEPDLQLFNFGREFIGDVDFFDTSQTDAFGTEITTNFAGRTNLSYQGKTLTTGKKIIFSNDINPEVRKTIYLITVVTLNSVPTVLLSPYLTALDHQNIKIIDGDHKDKNFYLLGDDWTQAQIKTSTNQLPLFDVVDNNFNSFSELSLSSFSGTRLFGYKVGTGVNDTVLGFPLSYKSINNIGDIEFSNHYELESFQYLENQKFVDKRVASGFLVKNNTRTDRVKTNIWTTVNSLTKQYQQYTVYADGNTNAFSFKLTPTDQSQLETNLKVYVDGILKNSDQYDLLISNSTLITFPTPLNTGSKLDVLIYSNNYDVKAFYQIPKNLEINPLNKDFEYITLGQIRNHTRQIFSELNDLSGIELGSNNSKDLNYKNIGGTILQHASPLVYANLFLTHDRANFVDAIHYAQREYSKFKNRFLEHAAKINVQSKNQIVNAVDQVLEIINSSKNLDSPWYYSDMVPFGKDYNEFVYRVLDVDIRNYYIETIFNDQISSNRAVLVYRNGIQLRKDIDYSFSQTIPSIVLADNFAVSLDDEIKIVDYNNTDGNYIPETPSKLGIYPKFDPKIYIDDRYITPTRVIQGHDGSITPCFNDYRDQMLLELELRIFNNIKTKFDEDVRSVLHNIKPGKFRENIYSLDEYDRVLSKSFLKWLGSNQVDYVNNLTYENSNGRTWNYKRSGSIFDGELLPGHWRGIFHYLYDTDRPNTHPWEMLGFSVKPSWWEDTYGPAPYTGGNKVLWDDLEQGLIKSGDRAGIDLRFARPGLSNCIPVNEFGELKSPNQFLIQSLNSTSTSAVWAVGDHGPVETAWRLSSDFPYAVQLALALTRPAEYFSLLIDNRRYFYDNDLDQILFDNSKDRLRPEQLLINGLDSSGNINRIAGYTNFISDYLTGQGISGSTYLKDLINSVDVRLGYRLAGFSDKKNLKIYVEQTSPGSTNDSIIIPEENYQLYLHKSAPNRRASYSSVIVKKTPTGYTVEGYDYNSPYFIIVPSRVSNEYTIIRGIEKTAKVYQDFQSIYLTIPYGFEFQNRQQLVDFLVSYQRYLISLGFTFNEFDEDLKRARDWILSASEFLTWSEQGWGENSVIVLSPCVGKLTLIDNNSTVDEINGKWTGSRLLDQNFTGIDNINFDVIRDNDSFEIQTLNDRIIGLADLAMVQYEHVLILDNETVFNDVIYNPELGNRQYRLKISGVKSGNWTGRLNAPGFVFNNGEIEEWSQGRDYFKGDLVTFKNRIYSALEFIPASESFEFEYWSLKTDISTTPELLINFAGNARKFLNIYDVDADYYDIDLEEYSNNLIGFKNRPYLDDFSLDAKTQVKFYQGFIREKGTANAVRALTRATFNKITGDIDFAEEWAVRVGTYGAVDNQKTVEMIVEEKINTGDPFGVEIIVPGDTPTENFRSYLPNQLYDAPLNFDSKLFVNRDPQTGIYDQDLTNAGFIKESEVDAVVFDLATSTEQLNSLISNIGIGYTVWTAKDFTGQWNIFRVIGTDHQVESIGYGLDNTCQITTADKNDLTVGETIIVKGFDPLLDGVYHIISRDSDTAFTVRNTDLQSLYLSEAGTLESTGILYKLSSLKFNKLTDVIGESLSDGSIVYLENSSGWSVYEKIKPWNWVSSFNGNKTDNNWGATTTISGDQSIVAVSVPSTSNSIVEYYNISIPNNIYYKSLSPLIANSTNFGFSLTQAEQRLFVSSKTDDSNPATFDRNYIAVYDYFTNRYNVNQIITGANNHSEFGYSLSASEDKKWLAVGSPADNTVYVYKLIDIASHQQQFTSTNGLATYTVDWTPSDIESLRLYRFNDQRYLLPGVDFTISGTTLTFTVAPTTTGTFYIIEDGPYYKLQTTITPSDGVVGDRFGDSVRLTGDGRQLFISAPNKSTSAGSIYVFDRTVEAFISVSGQDTFNTVRTLTNLFYDVRVDGNYKTLTTDFTKPSGTSIKFNVPFEKTSRVEIESNGWLPIQKINANLVQNNSKFGQALDICSIGCNLYASQPEYSTTLYNKGIVSRFVNIPINNNEILGSVIANVNSVVSVNDSIRINDQEITFTATTLQHVVSQIGNKITGVTVSIVGGNRLKIVNDPSISLRPLTILPGVTANTTPTAEKLGLLVFQHQQTLYKPDSYDNQSFGLVVKVNRNANQILISGQGGFNDIYRTFDAEYKETTFDVDSTTFYDRTINTGNVYEYELLVNYDNTSGLEFIQKITPSVISNGDNFGKNILVTDQKLIVLSKKDSQLGKVDIFDNVNQAQGWNLVRSQDPIVDLNSIGTLYLYDKRKNVIISYLDNVDPLRGKVLGPAEQEIDYRAAFDPAVYNVVDGINISSSGRYFWSNLHVGRVWWNLDTVRYVEYQQDNIKFRFDNWGKLFPGSSIDIYEWVESPVLPSEYVNSGLSGVPKHPDNSAYTEIQIVDTQTGLLKTRYYFWVINKITEIPGRNISIAGIKNIIEQPLQQGIPYAAILDDHSLALYNCRQFLTGEDIVLKIIGNTEKQDLPVHNEWHLLKQNDVDVVPEFIVDKMFDSIIGEMNIEVNGVTVSKAIPDQLLPQNKRYGIAIRPRQSMFVRRLDAAKVYVEYLNRELAKNIIVGRRDLTRLLTSDPVPNDSNYEYEFDTYDQLLAVDLDYVADQSRFLVRADRNRNNNWSIYKNNNGTLVITSTQKYNVSNFWTYRNWYKEGYDPRTVPDYVVSDFSAAPQTGIQNGQLIKINNTGSGQWGVYQKTESGYDPLALENATIEISSLIFDPDSGGIGFDSINFDDGFYDYNPSVDLRLLLTTIKEDITIEDLSYIFNRSIFVMFEYVLFEQNQPDWLFKTSFISVEHKIRKLIPYPNYVLDNQEYYKSYIEEVKPYKTKIREYLLNYNGLDNTEMDVTDFDYPVFFDAELNRYRHPVAGQDDDIINSPPWKYWKENNSYSVNVVNVINSGENYITEPTLVVTGGDGSIRLVPVLNAGRITSVRVDNPGGGFFSSPTITVYPVPNPDGSLGSGAVLKANIVNNKVRTVDTRIKFDRIEYAGTISNFVIGSVLVPTQYRAGDFFINNNKIYTVLNDYVQQGQALGSYTVTKTLTTAITSIGPYSYFQQIVLNNITSMPTKGYIKIDDEIFYYSASTGSTTLIGVERAQFDTEPATHLAGATVTLLDYKEASVGDLNSAMKRSYYYYNPLPGMIADDLRALYSGLEYPGVKIQGEKFFKTTVTANITMTNTGPILINIGTGQAIKETQSIRVIWDINNYMVGVVTSYNENTGDLIIEVSSSVGGGTRNGTWTLEKEEVTEFDVLLEGEVSPELKNLDVWYKSSFLDTSLGVDSDDIDINGGRFVDTANSHAPEELIPGRIYDTLEIRVFNKTTTNTVIGWRQFHTMNSNLIDANMNSSGIVQIIEEISPADTQFTVKLFGESPLMTPVTGPIITTPDSRYPEIMINGELMTYSAYNKETGVVSGLTRGLNGPAKTHPANSFVNVRNNLSGTRFYYRISNFHTTTLAQALNATDKQIKLVSAANMYQPSVVDNKPGVIYIDGERIHYWTLNTETNVLGQIIRGVNGTGIATVHAAGTRVTSASENQMLDTGDNKIWVPFATGQATINGTTMTITGPITGTFVLNQTIYGPGVAPNTKITGYGPTDPIGSPFGGAGTYFLSSSHNLAVAFTVRAGLSAEQATSPEIGFMKQYLSYTV